MWDFALFPSVKLFSGCLPQRASGAGRRGSDRVLAFLSGANANGLVDGADEDLAVADAAGMSRGLDRLDGALHLRVLYNHLDFHLRQEVHDVYAAAIELGVALLPAKALGFGDGNALDADF